MRLGRTLTPGRAPFESERRARLVQTTREKLASSSSSASSPLSCGFEPSGSPSTLDVDVSFAKELCRPRTWSAWSVCSDYMGIQAIFRG